MAWTSPGTAVTGAVLTASYWNTQVRDNLRETGPHLVDAQGQILVSDGANSLKKLAAMTSADLLTHEVGGLEADISAIVAGNLLVGGETDGELELLAALDAGEILVGKDDGNKFEAVSPMTQALFDAGSDQKTRGISAELLSSLIANASGPTIIGSGNFTVTTALTWATATNSADITLPSSAGTSELWGVIALDDSSDVTAALFLGNWLLNKTSATYGTAETDSTALRVSGLRLRSNFTRISLGKTSSNKLLVTSSHELLDPMPLVLFKFAA